MVGPLLLPAICRAAFSGELWRKRVLPILWPIRPGIGALLIAFLFALYGIAQGARLNGQPWGIPDWVWFTGAFALVAGEAFLIQREGRRRDDLDDKRQRDFERSENRLAVIFDRLELLSLISHLETELPQREAYVAGSGQQDAQRIVSLAGQVLDFVKQRVSVQPPPLTEPDRFYSQDASSAVVETVVLLHDAFQEKIESERTFLASLGLKGRSYEESSYQVLTLTNVLRVINLQSRLAMKIPSIVGISKT